MSHTRPQLQRLHVASRLLHRLHISGSLGDAADATLPPPIAQNIMQTTQHTNNTQHQNATSAMTATAYDTMVFISTIPRAQSVAPARSTLGSSAVGHSSTGRKRARSGTSCAFRPSRCTTCTFPTAGPAPQPTQKVRGKKRRRTRQIWRTRKRRWPQLLR